MSLLPDGTVNPGEMTSFNHYALGAVADWLHRSVAGLAPARLPRAAGPPLPRHGLTHASASHRTPYGPASVSWRRAGGRLTLRVGVPVGATAVVHVPGVADPVRVEHGEHDREVPDPVAGPPVPPAEPAVRDLLDHEPTWTRVVEEAVALGIVDGEQGAAKRLARHLAEPAARLVDALTPSCTPARG